MTHFHLSFTLYEVTFEVTIYTCSHMHSKQLEFWNALVKLRCHFEIVYKVIYMHFKVFWGFCSDILALWSSSFSPWLLSHCIGQVVHTYEGHTADVHLLLPFGSHLISVDNTSNVIVWDIQSEGKAHYNNKKVRRITVICLRYIIVL